MKKILLIDANALIHRSFHALPSFASSTGQATGALYGLSNILLKILKKDPPDYLAAFFDRPEPTFRKELYSEYKAHRPKAPDELISQIKEARRLFEQFGVKVFEIPGFEADDLIGAAVKKFKDANQSQIVILTGDLDTLQLVEGNKIVVEALKKGISETIIYNETAVKEKYGISPEQIPDYKGLVGDQSDNIPGVKGVGPKTAAAFIQKYKTLENFFQKHQGAGREQEKTAEEKLGKKSESAIQKIISEKEIALLSKRLAVINQEASLAIDNLEEIKYGKLPLEHIIKYFESLGFQSLIKRLREFQEISQKNLLAHDHLPAKEIEFLKHQPTLSLKIAEEVEAPLTAILKEMENIGIKVDIAKLKEKRSAVEKGLDKLTKEIYQEAGEVFNINSPKQTLDILNKKFKLSLRSTAYEKLIKLKNVSLAKLILEYRELFKLNSTYFIPLIERASQDAKSRIHPTFVQLKAATGRITCENPNLQNIPKSARDVFVPEKGYKLAAFDYSQIELRIIASLCEDAEMINVFLSGKDIHQMTASKIFRVKSEDVNSSMRQIAKTLNFGIIYGMGSRSFSEGSGLSLAEAKKFIAEYFAGFPAIKIWQENVLKDARQNGYVENLNGRRRYLPEIISFNPRIQAEAERMAVNFPVQSLAADIIKMAMIGTKEKLTEKNYWSVKAHMLLTIHDELVFEIKDDESLPGIAALIKETMENVYVLKAPLSVKSAAGDSWKDL